MKTVIAFICMKLLPSPEDEMECHCSILANLCHAQNNLGKSKKKPRLSGTNIWKNYSMKHEQPINAESQK